MVANQHECDIQDFCMHGLVPDYLNCVIARNVPTRALRSVSDHAEENGQMEQLCGGRPNHMEHLAKVCEIN